MLTSTFLSIISIMSLVSAVPIGEHSHNIHKRETTCSFPSGSNVVKLSTNKGGWAMDGDCTPGHFCQYACQPGYLMGQWNPNVTFYTYPGSQDGGIYCDTSGNAKKLVSRHDYCYEGKGTASVSNKASQNVAWCQTVLPGNEAMLIPTDVQASGSETIAVPGTDYWAGTAAHYYINPPGVSAEEGCTWGSTSNPYGNWSPYVAGVNQDDSGSTFAKIGWNPVYFEGSSPFKNTKPNYGIRMKCSDPSKCNGNTCEINPQKYGLNQVSQNQQSKSDGAAWCVLTATGGSSITFEVFDTGS